MKTKSELIAQAEAVEELAKLRFSDDERHTAYYEAVMQRGIVLRMAADKAPEYDGYTEREEELRKEKPAEPAGTNYTANKESAPTSIEFENGRKVWIVDDYLEVGWSEPRLQACRPEDRAMLQTSAGKELIEAAIAAMTEVRVSDTPITDKATYWYTAEGGYVVNPADMEALERQMNALTAKLARVTAELAKWQRPFDQERLDAAKQQASRQDSLAAMQVYITALEHGMKAITAERDALKVMCEKLAEALRRCEADEFPHKATGYAKATLAKWQAMKEEEKT